MDKVTGIIIVLVVIFALVLVMVVSRGSSRPNDQQLSSFSEPTSAPSDGLPTTSPSGENIQGPLSPDATQSARFERAIVTTSKGSFTIELYPDDAPKTVANFGEKAQDGFYDGLTFHRVEDWVVQGGDPLGNGTGGGDMETELNDKPFVDGSVGVARGGNIEISNDSQFFVTKGAAGWLDNQYTNFGIVTEGMDVVESMEIGDEITSIEVE